MQNIVLTGAYGNVGQSTIQALLDRGMRVRAFDIETAANRKAAVRFEGQVETVWGDLRRPDDVRRAVAGADAVLHLGFVIPTLSATGVGCEQRPDWAREINVGGTCNLIQALQDQSRPGTAPRRLVFASSLHIYGHTQHLPPPRYTSDTPRPVEHYAHHKVEAEQMVRESGLCWAILRLGAALPLRLIMDTAMFDVPLNNRIEFVHTRDAGAAFAAAAEHPGVLGRTLHIGGGERCQMVYRDMMRAVLDATGVGALPDWAFTTQPYAVDWLDTREAQALLRFQTRTFEDYTRDLRKKVGALRGLVLLLRPAVRRWLLSRSPYGKAGRKQAAGV